MVLTTKFRYLLILVAVITTVALFRPHEYLPPSAQAYLPQKIWSSPPLPEIHGSPTTDTVSKQSLWNEIHHAFELHRPVYFDRLAWPSDWPTMPTYQMNKAYDKAEVLASSPVLSADDEKHAIELQVSLQQSLPTWHRYAQLFSGTGYVMTTGSPFLNRVFPIGLQMLHRLGSGLPIEIWTKDQEEYDITLPMVESLATQFSMSITCHRFSDYVDISQFPAGYGSNYLMKAMAILFSSFERVIFLDADNVPMLSPEPLLESQEFLTTGLLLWPDFWSNSLSATLHTILSIPYTFERTCESGQIVIDKSKHFTSLLLANYYNWYGEEYFYRLITLDGMGTGDKDTFVVGAQSVGAPFHFTTQPVTLLRAVFLNGTQWREDRSVFNGAMGQFNPLNSSQIMFMHMHSPKLNFQEQDEVTFDLSFVGSDEPNVHFHPNEAHLERLLWESIVWVECSSVLHDAMDPQKLCEGASARLALMTAAV